MDLEYAILTIELITRYYENLIEKEHLYIYINYFLWFPFILLYKLFHYFKI